MFSEHKPIYFVFQHENETYYLDSCLSLSARDYLWYHLKRDKMQHIFFLEDAAGDAVRLTVSDEASFLKNTYDSGGLFAKKLWNSKKECPSADFTADVPAEAAASWLLLRLSEPDTAICADVETLYRLFPTPFLQDTFIERLSTGKGSIILTFPMNPAGKDLELIVGKDSMFRRRNAGRCLFKPLYALLTSGDESAAIFDELKKSAPDRSIEAGYLDFETVKTLIRNVGFAQKQHFSEDEFYDHANYLFYWLENAEVKKTAGGLFSGITGSITGKKLFDALTKGQFSAFKEREEALRTFYRSKYPQEKGYIPMSKILFALYGPKNTADTESHVLLSNPALEKLQATEFPLGTGSEASEFQIVGVARREWDEMRSLLRKPKNTCFAPEKTDWIQAFLSYLAPAESCNDRSTLKRTVNMLMYCGNNLYAVPSGEYLDYCKKGKQYLDLSKEYFLLRREVIKTRNEIEAGKAAETAAVAAAEANLYKYHMFLKDFDTIFVQTQKILSGFTDFGLDDVSALTGEAMSVSDTCEAYPENEEPVFSAQKHKIDEEINAMSEEEQLAYLKNELF